ncbi:MULTISPECIES: hypothetical protein [unclassified Achromobacter]|uniref:hypothetical protein n=1 Tax=unclassified Achromobacter TaxID=2626865 RepID=UPI000B51D6EF|nr:MULTISPECIES: hypothetical protein [unclassified Achromobacter]OWT68074.1 hypothetical protein CEY05_29000 [Achromobacter sp. HZ34]OWT69911.1 hypothetical protein CEY04_27830 [Achromobacter sp. HZ28]
MIVYKWLHPIPLQFGACFSAVEFYREMRQLKCDDPPSFTCDKSAAVHTFEGSDDSIRMLLTLDPVAAAAQDGIEIAALLAHEAVHVMQECRRWMGEKEPGSEWEAYTVQHVAQEFMGWYQDYMKKGAR